MQTGGSTVLRLFFFFQAEDGIRDKLVTGVQTCALPIFEPAEGLAVDDAVAIERERGSRRRRLFGAIATGVRGSRRVLGEIGLFELFGVLAEIGRASCRERV